MRMRTRPNNPVPKRKARSRDGIVLFLAGPHLFTAAGAPPLAALAVAFAPARAHGCPDLPDLDLLERCELELHDLCRQWRVPEVGAVLLAIGQRPVHEVDHHLGL